MARLPPVSTGSNRPSLTVERRRVGRALSSRHWIFGYGSLAHVENLAGYLARHRLKLGDHGPARLDGFARTWTVAMDNRQTLPRYKYYLDPDTGARPEIFVAFVNIVKQEEARVSGILFEVDARMLEVFDSRERNYWRTDVTAHFSEPVDGTVWTYVGNPEANACFQKGLRKNALVIDAAYLQGIETAFARAGLPYSATLPQNVPVKKLTRVET